MRTPVCRTALILALMIGTSIHSSVAAQTPWVLDWLQAYADGHQAEVVAKLPTISSLKQLQDDLEALLPKWTDPKSGAVDQHRRAIIAFAIEAAFAKLERGPEVAKLTEWACRQIRRHPQPDEFDHRAQMATFALLAGAVDPDAIEAHVTHVKFQFPGEPRLALERGVAEELRSAPFYDPGRESPGDIIKRREEAVRRFTEAAKIETTRAEASLRLGKVLLDQGKPEDALAALDHVEPATTDPTLIYLARLFRGLALDRLDRRDESRRAFEQALSTTPGAESASLGLAALLFKSGDRSAADHLAQELLTRTPRTIDPWWEYWPGDYRLGTGLVTAMREAVK
jgi:tetratricopeptide (TPR) repeat protein